MADLPRLRPAPDHPMPDAEASLARQPKIKAGVRTSSACLSCRKRRTKCTGTGPPCESCARHGTECVYNAESDQRRKEVARRTRDDLQYYRRILNDMIQAFRSSGPDRIEYLLSVIRSTDSLDEIAVALHGTMADVRQQGQRAAHPRPEPYDVDVDAPDSSSPRKRRMVMSIQSLSDEPLFDLPAKPWTTITDDDHFVSHLVSLYFTWEHAACHVIDRELFLEDMRHGQLDSQCCSPLLVNALLATACCFSDYPEACAVQGRPETRGDQFLAEATRLWEHQRGTNSLANCGALCMMAIFCKKSGRDMLGQIYFNTATQMYSSLMSSRQTTLSPNNFRQVSPKMQRARSVTAWALFQINTMMAMSLFKGTKFDADDIVRPFDVPVPSSAVGGIAWSPYPRHNGAKRACLDVFVHQQLDLAEVVDEINAVMAEPGDRPVDLAMWQIAERLAGKLLAWYEHLPPALQLEDAPPHFLTLRVQYHYSLISLYKFFTPGQRTVLPAHITHHAKALCVQSAKEIAALAAIHARDFGFDRMSFVFAEGVALALFVLLTDLESEQSAHAFFETAVAVRAAGRRFLFAKGVLRIAHLTAVHTHIDLPPRAHRLFKDFAAQAWRPADVTLFNSELPNVALMIRPDDVDTDLIGLSALFERWEGAPPLLEGDSPDTDSSSSASHPASPSP